MITNTKSKVTNNMPALDKEDYHIDAEHMAHLMQILRDLYARPHEAVLREYVANAVDAHVSAGVDTPIIVTLPSSTACVADALGGGRKLTIRDFGGGLSVEDTKRLLFSYGSSGDEKRLSNDQIGGFGIGCKCAFAIADQFTYTVYHGGRCRVWSCFLDEDDVGRAMMVSDKASTEEPGIEVSIPVPADMAHHYAQDDAVTLLRYLPKPITVVSQPGGPRPTAGFDLATRDTTGRMCGRTVCKVGDVSHTIHWDFGSPRTGHAQFGPIVVAGGFEYDIDFSMLPGIPAPSLGRGFYRCLTIYLPIGFIPLAPSRESFKYTRRTCQLLEALVLRIAEEWRDVRLREATSLRDKTVCMRCLDGFPLPKCPALAGVTNRGADLSKYASRMYILDAHAWSGVTHWCPPDIQAVKLEAKAPSVVATAHRFSDEPRAGLADVLVLVPSDQVALDYTKNRALLGMQSLLQYVAANYKTDPAVYSLDAKLMPRADITVTMIQVEGGEEECIAKQKELEGHPAVMDGSLRIIPFVHTLDLNIVKKRRHGYHDYYISDGAPGPRVCLYSWQPHNEPTAIGAGSTAKRRVVKAHSRKYVQLDPVSGMEAHPERASDRWTAVDAKGFEGGVYVLIDKFEMISSQPGSTTGCGILPTLVHLMRDPQLLKSNLFPKAIYGIRVGDRADAEKSEGMALLNDHMKDVFTRLLADGTITIERMAWHIMSNDVTEGSNPTLHACVDLLEYIGQNKRALRGTRLWDMSKDMVSYRTENSTDLGVVERAAYKMYVDLYTSMMAGGPGVLPDEWLNVDSYEARYLMTLDRHAHGDRDPRCLPAVPLLEEETPPQYPDRNKSTYATIAWAAEIKEKYPLVYALMGATARACGRRMPIPWLGLDFKDYVEYVRFRDKEHAQKADALVL